MTVNTPMTEVIRTWRKIGASDHSDQAAERAFDEAIALGYTDRMMLLAASRVALQFLDEYANVSGLTLDAMLESSLREFLIQEK